jgi:uncharacterized phage protein (TIGR01671 family)
MLGFRVWCPGYSDKPGKMEYYDSAFDDEQHFLLRADGTLVMACAYYPAPDSFAPMQSTGLKDMTGKEIFEGDILEVIERKSLLIAVNVLDFIFYFSKQCGWQARMERKTIQMKIIGNIYENPELLEKIKC